MEYDPIKRTLGKLFNQFTATRRLFYFLLDVLLLRTWHIHREIRHFFRQSSQKQGSILDAGSGFGQYTWYMARNKPSWTVEAVDVKQEQIEDCRQFFSRAGVKNASFRVADLTSFRKPGQFNLILSVDVMEHIEEDLGVFANFHQSLKPGGLLLISTPSDKGGSDVDQHGESSFIEEHVRDGYSVEDITRKLHQAGFSKVETRYSYGRPGNLSWRISMKAPISMLGVSRIFLLVLPLYYLLVMPFALILNAMDLNMNHESGTGLVVKAWKGD